MKRRGMSAAERRAEAECRAYAARAPQRRLRTAFFVGAMALVVAMIGAMVDPTHRLSGFLFGGLAGMFIGIALRAWPGDSDYSGDILDRLDRVD